MLAQGEVEDINACIADIQQGLPGYITETRIIDLPRDPRHREFRITF